MKKILILILTACLLAACSDDDDDNEKKQILNTSTVEFNYISDPSQPLELIINASVAEINWGDGNSDIIDKNSKNGNLITHTYKYDKEQSHKVQIKATDMNNLHIKTVPQTVKLLYDLKINSHTLVNLNINNIGMDELALDRCPNLQTLNLSYSRIKNLDLSKTSALTFVDMYANIFETVNISDNKNINYLSIDRNELPSLDINCPELKILDLKDNMEIKELDLSNCPKLSYLSVVGNHNLEKVISENLFNIESYIVRYNLLKSLTINSRKLHILEVASCDSLNYLNVSECNELQKITVRYTKSLKKLDFSQSDKIDYLIIDTNENLEELLISSPELEELYCVNNKLKTLDISHCTSLQKLYIEYNKLQSLSLSTNKEIHSISIFNNNMDASALNDLFHTLPEKKQAFMHISQNPGTYTCDPSIAEKKGWEIYY